MQSNVMQCQHYTRFRKVIYNTTITCNAKFVGLHITSITLKTCNALQCITSTLIITPNLLTTKFADGWDV